MKQCTKCLLQKVDEAFSFKNKTKGIRSPVCRECHKVLRREHYLRNRQKYVKKAMAYAKKSAEWLAQYKTTLRCASCGFSHPAAIDFHHSSGDKTENVAYLYKHGPGRIMKEIEKCTPLCANCHRILHFEERQRKKQASIAQSVERRSSTTDVESSTLS